MRTALEDGIRDLQAEQRRIDLGLQRTRNRESELSQTLQLEESKWNDLISRLEQLMAR